MRDFPGCIESGNNFLAGYIFGPSMGGRFRHGQHLLTEVYPALWSAMYPREARNTHQQDAFAVTAWLRDADSNGSLVKLMCPALRPDERKQAEIEGWILGVG